METALASLKTDLGDGYQKRVRQCAGFLSLLQMLKAAPKYASPYSAAMFLRKAAFVREPAEKQGSHLLLDRKIGFLEVENVKLMEATLRGIEMIEKLVKSVQGTKSDTEILNQRVFSINSNQLSSKYLLFHFAISNCTILQENAALSVLPGSHAPACLHLGLPSKLCGSFLCLRYDQADGNFRITLVIPESCYFAT